MKKIILFNILFLTLNAYNIVYAQETSKDIREMTREEVLNMPYEELMDMPLDQLLILADIVGVSLEELYEMILNKDVVSASKKVESSFEAPLSTSVISSEEIKASGALTIEEALRLVPGLIVRQKTNGNFDVHIRGNDNIPPNNMILYSENSISLVMIDGRPVYNYVHGGTFWETLPIDLLDIERIEVVRGPSSALYGPNAVSGVVNIITKRVEDNDLHFNVNAQGGTQETAMSSIAVSKGITDKLSFRLSGNAQWMDRNDDKLYVFKVQDYITKDQLEVLDDPFSEGYKVFDPADDVDDMFPDPSLSRKRMGANGFLFMDMSEDINADLSFGIQSSDVISTTMGDNPMAHVGRLSNTVYADLRSKIKGLNIQVNGLNGWQDIVKEDTGFKVDAANFNVNAEYDIDFNNLNIRPGISYQNATYNDMEYLRFEGQGFLNGKKQLNSTAASLRLDYQPVNGLRLIAALRGEKYNTHDDPYLSYQFIGSYNLNDVHNLRLVYGRANRGPFLVDTYADYLWNRDGRPNPGHIYFNGSKNLDLLTMDMYELGYRVKPLSNVQADFEFFYTRSDDYGLLMPDSVSIFYQDLPTNRPYARMSYQNIRLASEQFGFTGSVSWVVSKEVNLKAFATWQQTTLYDYYPLTPEKTMELMFEEAYMNGLVDLNGDGIPEDFTGDGIPDPYPPYYIDLNQDGSPDDLTGDGVPDMLNTTPYATERPDTLVEELDHEATPSVFGGAMINYTGMDERLSASFNTYFYTGQTFISKNGTQDIDPKVILNLKISYKVFGEHSVFINARNLINDDKREFAFMDDIGGLYLIGLNLQF